MQLESNTICTYNGRNQRSYRLVLHSSHRLFGQSPSYKGEYPEYRKECDKKKIEAIELLFGVHGQDIYLRTPNPDRDENGVFTYIWEYTVWYE